MLGAGCLVAWLLGAGCWLLGGWVVGGAWSEVGTTCCGVASYNLSFFRLAFGWMESIIYQWPASESTT